MNWEDYMIPCMSKTLFGIECPGCGAQRSLLLLIQGDFQAAFHMYPPIYTLLPFLVLLGLHLGHKSKNYDKPLVALAILNGIAMITAYLYKIFLL